MAYKVKAGYVTVQTKTGKGRAHVDIPRGSELPGDVPAEQIQALLRLGHIEEYGGDKPQPRKRAAKKTAAKSDES